MLYTFLIYGRHSFTAYQCVSLDTRNTQSLSSWNINMSKKTDVKQMTECLGAFNI